MSKLILKPHQLEAVNFLTTNNTGVIVMDTGGGKTASMLTAIFNTRRKTIIAAPAKVVSVWAAEAAKWGCLSKLKITPLIGSPAHRIASLAAPADILVVSLNNLDHLLTLNHGCKQIVLDELSTACGKQTKKLYLKKALSEIPYRYGLTATPVANDLVKLFKMIRVIDASIYGRNEQTYLDKYFYATDYQQRNWEVRPGQEKPLLAAITHIVHVSKYNKGLVLPPVVHHLKTFALTPTTREVYATMVHDMVVGDVIAPNLAIVSGKLRQITSGFMINTEQNIVNLNDTGRADTAKEWATELLGAKGVIVYQFNHQLAQLEQALADFDTITHYGGSTINGIELFKQGLNQILICQQSCVSHGVDSLQYVTSELCFYAPVWSNDEHLQLIGRLARTGQTNPVNVTTIECLDSIDQLVSQRLIERSKFMGVFLDHLKAHQ